MPANIEGNGELWRQVQQMILENRDLTIPERDALLLTRMNDINAKLNTIIRNVEQLQADIRGNIAFKVGVFIKQHPKASIAIFLFIFVILNLWFVSGWRQPVLDALGVPAPLIP